MLPECTLGSGERCMRNGPGKLSSPGPSTLHSPLRTLSGSDRQIMMRTNGGLDGAAECSDALVRVVVGAGERDSASGGDQGEPVQVGRAVLGLDGDRVECVVRHHARAAAQQADPSPLHATLARTELEDAPL